MGDFMADISGIAGGNSANAMNQVKANNDSFELNMQDFLNLMVAELQNQTMDNTADTSEMLNQMVMMQMVSALTNMTDASVMSYAASLVGKTVTVGEFNESNELKEIVGTVTGTGMMNGQQVVFVNDKCYYMSEIMAVGTLPEKVPEEPPKEPDKTDSTKPTEPETKPESSTAPDVAG